MERLLICDHCGWNLPSEEAHTPHDSDCIRQGCECDNIVCPVCCPECHPSGPVPPSEDGKPVLGSVQIVPPRVYDPAGAPSGQPLRPGEDGSYGGTGEV